MLGPLPDQPFVGVFGLTYNHEDFVAEAIESVLAAGWPSDRFEYVLLDDGSTDATPERVKPYLDHITYIRQENQGINASVERVVGRVRGDVIVCCSGDDVWPQDKLEHTIGYMREHPAVGLLYGDLDEIDRKGNVVTPSLLRRSGAPPPEGQIAGRLLTGNFINAGTMAFRGELKGELLPMPADVAWEDWWFAWMLTNLAPVGFVDAVVYRYRKHGENFLFGLDDRERVIDRLQAEVPFRRYLLGNARPGTCTPAELFSAAQMLRNYLNKFEEIGRDVASIVKLDDAARAAAARLAQQADATARKSPLLAAFAAARALAADPYNEHAFGLLRGLAGMPNTPPPQWFDGARSVAVFADLEELVSEPGLLAGYVSAFGADDDVTLIAVAREWDEARIAAEVGPLEQLLSGDDTPDVIAAPGDARAYLNGLTRADAALGLRDLPVPGVERFSDPAELRAYVERRWRLPLVTN